MAVITVVALAQQFQISQWRVSYPQNCKLFEAFSAKAAVGFGLLLCALTIPLLVSSQVGSWEVPS